MKVIEHESEQGHRSGRQSSNGSLVRPFRYVGGELIDICCDSVDDRFSHDERGDDRVSSEEELSNQGGFSLLNVTRVATGSDPLNGKLLSLSLSMT